MDGEESIASNSQNQIHCKIRSSNSGTEASESCNIQPVKRRRKNLQSEDSEGSFVSATPPKNVSSLNCMMISEISLLKRVIEEHAIPLIRNRLQIWQTVMIQYNEEANKQNMETRTLMEVLTMAKAIDWCKCSDDNKDNCSCYFFKVPMPTVSSDLTVPPTSRNSGSLGKRSYDAIASSDSLCDQLAELINSLVSSKHISVDMRYTAGQFYENMINKGRTVVVRMFLKEDDVTLKLYMERDMKTYPDCM